MAPVDLVLVLVFSLAWPMFGARFGVPALRAAVAAGTVGARRAEYLNTIFMQWTLAALAAAAALQVGRSAEALRLFPPAGAGLAIAAAAIIGAFLLFRAQRAAVAAPAGRDALRRQIEPLAWFLPQDAADRAAFRPLSVTAGVCEEWLFRGYLLAVLTPALGTWGAIVASTVLFGVAHAYQGPMGIVRTGLVGLVFALLTWATGSIWPAVVIHAAADWTQGDLIVRVLAPEEPVAAA